jgi:predicted dehydrogenase
MKMSEKIFNISIVGCGKVAHLHAKAVQSITNASLSGVWSRTRSTADAFAIKYNTRSYDSVYHMVKDNNPDLVIVCSPHMFHRKPAIEAAEAGANVLVEKPHIEVDDTAVAIVKFRSGAIGNILVSNSQKPGIHGKVQVHGENGSSVGVQADGSAIYRSTRDNLPIKFPLIPEESD